MIENERKSNEQLKQMLELKDNQNKQQQPTTTTNKSSSCSKCDDLKQLLEIEKENSVQLTQQLQNQIKQTEEQRNGKQVFAFLNHSSHIFNFSFRQFNEV